VKLSNLNPSWSPVVGVDSRRFINEISFLDEVGREKLISDACKILGRCAVPSSQADNRSLIVVGEVQSGKTLSFTTVMSLARDNGFRIIVLLAGTKKNLLNQTHERLLNDLHIEDGSAGTQWKVIKNPKVSAKGQVIQSIETWSDPHVPDQFRETAVLVVLKTESGINHASSLIREIQNSLNSVIPVLVIDDEADQASLNVSSDPEVKSSTYRAVSKLRDSLPNHSYVMYTATAQALLLLDFVDHLSPDSVVVLESGSTYIGGKQLFEDLSSRFFREIPFSEISVATDPNPVDPPPNSLQKALAFYFVALCVAQQRRSPAPLSMLIHPAARKQVHERYKVWVTDILGRWLSLLEDEDEGGFQAIVEKEFVPAIAELRSTCNLSETFPDISEEDLPKHIGSLIRYWIKKVEVRVVNSEKQANEIGPKDWVKFPGWIVIGGAKLERGFTIENLAITYMPRGSGIGAADTIQQRGRFFGHKSNYKDLLRGWLNADTRDAFRSNVEFEEGMRSELRIIDSSNVPLQSWRREFFLGSGMVATRQAVISLAHQNIDLRSGFRFKQDHLFHEALKEMHSETMSRIETYFKQSIPVSLDTRNVTAVNTRTNIPIGELIELILDWPMTREDRSASDHLLIALKYYGESQPNVDAHLYFMDQLEPRRRSRLVGEEPSDLEKRFWRTLNLHQGRSPQGGSYLGDAAMRTTDAVSVQIHNVIPRYQEIEYGPVLALAIAWPEGFKRTMILQD
jgi:hypothetical protein